VKVISFFVATAAALALSACGEPSAQPAPVETPVAVTEPVEPALPAPTQDIFSQVFAAACPSAKTVSIASCRSMGMGSKDFICEYGLGDDEYLRHKANLTPGDGEWTLADAENTCAQGA